MDEANVSRTSPSLLRRIRDLTDTKAWSEFVDRYGPKIYRWSRRHGTQHSDAQDITQEVLIKLHRYMSKFDYDPQKGRFRGWLKTVTIRAWSDYVEARKNTGTGDTWPFENVPDESLATSLEEEFDLEVLEEAKARVQLQVSERDWRVFSSCVETEQPAKEVAAMFGMQVGAVYVAKSRVQRQLKEEIQELEGHR